MSRYHQVNLTSIDMFNILVNLQQISEIAIFKCLKLLDKYRKFQCLMFLQTRMALFSSPEPKAHKVSL